MIAVIRSTGSNFASVEFALRRLGVDPVVTEDPDVVAAASHVILPGVGAAGRGMENLRATGLDTVIPQLTQPVLGICLGMQLMFERSEEDDTRGMGIFRGHVTKLDGSSGLPIPHMGWNMVQHFPGASSPVSGARDGWAYFVHSYAPEVGPDTVATTEYSGTFTSVAARDNFVGVQFHPERSASFGAAILESFLRMDPRPVAAAASGGTS